MRARRRPRKLPVVGTNPRLKLLKWVLGIVLIFAVGVTWQNSSRAGTAVQSKPGAATEVEMDLLPVPVRAVARGEALDRVDFVTTRWPRESYAQYVRSAQSLRGRVARVPLVAHAPIPESSVSSAQDVEANAVVQRIPEGMRAITVNVDAESAVEGWAQSGNFVDVILLRRPSEPQMGMEAQVIAENVRILSSGRSSEPEGGAGGSVAKPPSTVTLLVTQEDALRIKTAANLGKLTFALRGLGDQGPTLAQRTDQRDLSQRNKIPEVEEYQGTARDAKGNVYVLSKQGRWLKRDDFLQLQKEMVQGEKNQDEPGRTQESK